MNYTKENTKYKRKFLVEKLNGCCTICGYDKNLSALEFHHKKPQEKLFPLSSREIKAYSIEKLLNEVQKCILLCANCHREHHNPDGNDWKHLTKPMPQRQHIIKYCKCGHTISKNVDFCLKCTRKNQERIDWPSDELLAQYVWCAPRSILSKWLKISDRAIAKRCTLRNIAQPKRGYWQKLKLS